LSDSPKSPDTAASNGSPSPDPFELPVVAGADLDALLRDSSVPVVIDFFASWCGPCAWIIPTLRSIGEEHGPRVRILKIDVDEAPDLATRYRVASVPTIVVFKGTEEAGRSVGVEPERVREMVDAAVRVSSG
jgi:thioredoxin 1